MNPVELLFQRIAFVLDRDDANSTKDEEKRKYFEEGDSRFAHRGFFDQFSLSIGGDLFGMQFLLLQLVQLVDQLIDSAFGMNQFSRSNLFFVQIFVVVETKLLLEKIAFFAQRKHFFLGFLLDFVENLILLRQLRGEFFRSCVQFQSHSGQFAFRLFHLRSELLNRQLVWPFDFRGQSITNLIDLTVV